MIYAYRISDVRPRPNMPRGWYDITLSGHGMWQTFMEFNSACPPQIGETRYLRHGMYVPSA